MRRISKSIVKYVSLELPYIARLFLERFDLRGWRVVLFGIGGTIARIVDLITGIIIIRSISPDAFASYALAVGTAPVYSTILLSGVLPSIWNLAGRGFSNLNAVIALRRQAEISIYRQNSLIFPLLALVTTPLMVQVTQDTASMLLASAATIALASATAHQTIADATLQLARRQITVLVGALIQTLVRIVFLPLVLLGDRAVPWLIASSVLAVICNYLFCRFMLVGSSCNQGFPSYDFDENVRSIRKRSFPIDIFQALSGQFYYWLLAFFAGPAAVSGFSALARLGQVTYPLSLLFRGYFVPGFARLPATAPLAKDFLALTAIASLLILPAVATAILYPDYVLLILGDSYRELKFSLFLYATGLLFWVVSDLADQLLRSRGAFLPPLLSMTIDLTSFLVPLLIFRRVSIEVALCSFVAMSFARLLKFVVFALWSFGPRLGAATQDGQNK